MGKLEGTALAEHAAAVVAKLEHPDERVREAAVETLHSLIAQDAPVVKAKLTNSEWKLLVTHAPEAFKLEREINSLIRRSGHLSLRQLGKSRH